MIFHSYVSLPEGSWYPNRISQPHWNRWKKSSHSTSPPSGAQDHMEPGMCAVPRSRLLTTALPSGKIRTWQRKPRWKIYRPWEIWRFPWENPWENLGDVEEESDLFPCEKNWNPKDLCLDLKQRFKIDFSYSKGVGLVKHSSTTLGLGGTIWDFVKQLGRAPLNSVPIFICQRIS